MANDKLRRHVAALETPELVAAAAKIAGFDLGKRPTFATAANVSGVRTRAHTFSRRRDCLTIFATDTRYGHLGKAGAWLDCAAADLSHGHPAVDRDRRVLESRLHVAELVPGAYVRPFQRTFVDIDQDGLRRVGRLVLGLGGDDSHRIALEADAT